MNESNKKKYSIIFTLLIGILLAFLIKMFIFDFIRTSGESMNPTLKNGEILCINKMAYGLGKPTYTSFIMQWNSPKKGDIVLFLHDNKIVVKRCILTEGDSLEILSDSEYSSRYHLIAGDKKLPLSREQNSWIKAYPVVPEGFVFVAGDNYENSVDSRNYGFVSVKNITGKVIGKR